MVKNLTYFDEDNMSLDCAMILNLKRREDRYWFALGGLKVLQFPDDRIIRFITHDGLDYESVESIQRRMIEDGFAYMEAFEPYSRSTAAWVWSWRCALRRIVEMDQTVLLLIDDFIPKHGWTYERLCYLVDACLREQDEHGPFRILQLLHTYRGDEKVDHGVYSSMLSKGLAGCQNIANILNAEGAKLLLDIGSQDPLDYPNADFGKLTSRRDDWDYFYGTWHTLDEICENSYDLGTDLSED